MALPPLPDPQSPQAEHDRAVCISARYALADDDLPGLDIAEFWEDALRRSIAARLIAEALGHDPEMYLAAGLLQDFGLLMMIHREPDKAGLWPSLRSADPESRYRQEAWHFDLSHEQAALSLFARHGLSDACCEAIATHHQPGSNAAAGILHCADWMNAVYACSDQVAALDHCRQEMLKLLGIKTQLTDSLLAKLPAQMTSEMPAFGLCVSAQQSFEDIIAQASTTLLEELFSHQDLNRQLQQALQDRDHLASELHRDLRLAREIQRNLLPPTLVADITLTGLNIPAKHLSGDFYDFYTRDDGCIAFCLGDVSGKGVNAAILMSKACGLFRGLGQHIRDPAEVMARINHDLHQTATRGMFITMIAGLYEPATNLVELVNAGHLPALLVAPDQRVTTFAAQQAPLGIDNSRHFQKIRFPLRDHSLYLFSDGLTEAHGPDDAPLEVSGLTTMLCNLAALTPAQRMAQLKTHIGSNQAGPRDDITVLLIAGQAQGHGPRPSR